MPLVKGMFYKTSPITLVGWAVKGYYEAKVDGDLFWWDLTQLSETLAACGFFTWLCYSHRPKERKEVTT